MTAILRGCEGEGGGGEKGGEGERDDIHQQQHQIKQQHMVLDLVTYIQSYLQVQHCVILVFLSLVQRCLSPFHHDLLYGLHILLG